MATRSAWGTTFTWAIATEFAPPCSGRVTATPVSRADLNRLYAPPIIDPVYGFRRINVEAQEHDPSRC